MTFPVIDPVTCEGMVSMPCWQSLVGREKFQDSSQGRIDIRDAVAVF